MYQIALPLIVLKKKIIIYRKQKISTIRNISNKKLKKNLKIFKKIMIMTTTKGEDDRQDKDLSRVLPLGDHL